jgi:hypothetical protein
VILARAIILIPLFAVAGCVTRQAAPGPQSAALTAAQSRQREIDERKDELMRQLAVCESGGHGYTDQKIYGGRGTYVGRFQFVPRTVINYVAQRDGRRITAQEAIDLAHDYDQAAELAKYVIFDLDGAWNWPLCNRKLGIAKQAAEIKQL